MGLGDSIAKQNKKPQRTSIQRQEKKQSKEKTLQTITSKAAIDKLGGTAVLHEERARSRNEGKNLLCGRMGQDSGNKGQKRKKKERIGHCTDGARDEITQTVQGRNGELSPGLLRRNNQHQGIMEGGRIAYKKTTKERKDPQ